MSPNDGQNDLAHRRPAWCLDPVPEPDLPGCLQLPGECSGRGGHPKTLAGHPSWVVHLLAEQRCDRCFYPQTTLRCAANCCACRDQ